MARKKPKGEEPEGPKSVRVRKREGRTGVKRAMNLVMLDDNCTRLEGYAALYRTTPAEIVQDWIERLTHGMTMSIPGGPSLTRGTAKEAGKPVEPETSGGEEAA